MNQTLQVNRYRSSSALFTVDDRWLADDGLSGPSCETEIWTTDRCLAVPHADVGLDGFDPAVTRVRAAGWNVAVRRSGGTAYPLDSSTCQVTIRVSDPAVRPSVAELYGRLCRPLLYELNTSLRNADIGRVTGCLCDGAYNVRVNNRKLAGTAQRVRAWGRGYRGVLQAVVGLSSPTDGAIDAVVQYYAALGRPIQLDAASHVGLFEVLPDLAGCQELALLWIGRAYRASSALRCVTAEGGPTSGSIDQAGNYT